MLRSHARLPGAIVVLIATACAAAAGLDSHPSDSSALADGAIVDAGRMLVPRASHSSTLLPDGRVLLAGGCAINGCDPGPLSASTEIYEPARGTFRRGPDLSAPRSGGHVAVLLRDGRVLITGGWSGPAVTTRTELFDPRRDAFGPGPDLSVPRAGASGSLLPDGRVLIAGGYDGSRSLGSTEIFDPSGMRFTAGPELSEARSEHAAVRLADGRVLLIGGSQPRGPVLRSAEVFDPVTARVTPSADLTVRRHKHAAALLRDGSVLVVGGSDERDSRGTYDTSERWSPDSVRFESTPSMHAARFKIANAVVTLGDGRVLIAGGAPEAEIYDPSTRSFRVLRGSFGAGRMFTSAVALPDGSALITGGYDNLLRVTNRAFRFVSAR